MKNNQVIYRSFYSTSLVASLMIGLDCFVIGFIFLYPFLGLIPSLIIASGGWVLNTFVYYKDGPANIQELIQSKEKRSWVSWLINIIALLGALFVLLFTIFAYLTLGATFPVLAMWVTPFLIATMAIAYFIGTFTLNKSELTKDLLTDDERSWFTMFREAILSRLGYTNTNQSYSEFSWRFFIRILLPMFVALVVSFAMTVCFYSGCLTLLAGCGLASLNPILMILAISFFLAEFYFNSKQNIELVDKVYDKTNDENKSTKWFTPGMIGIFIMVSANAVTNGFIAMDASLIVISSIAIIKFITGTMQSFCTMLNSTTSFMDDEKLSFDSLNGNQTKAVMTECSLVMAGLVGLYLISVFSPVGLISVCPVIIVLIIFKSYEHKYTDLMVTNTQRLAKTEWSEIQRNDQKDSINQNKGGFKNFTELLTYFEDSAIKSSTRFTKR